MRNKPFLHSGNAVPHEYSPSYSWLLIFSLCENKVTCPYQEKSGTSLIPLFEGSYKELELIVSDELWSRTHMFQSTIREDCPVVVEETERGGVNRKTSEETSSALCIFLKSEFRAWQNGSIYLPLTRSIKWGSSHRVTVTQKPITCKARTGHPYYLDSWSSARYMVLWLHVCLW